MSIETKWQAAQLKERSMHKETFEAGFAHYKDVYANYFKFVGIDPDLQGKNICEIGPADFPALAYCKNRGSGCVLVEPMPSEILKSFGILIIHTPAESLYTTDGFADEVWMFNLLQHVINPDQIIAMAKQANTIRFFEPINTEIDECHLHTFTLETYRAWFGDCVQHYPGGNNIPKFHTHECAYGVWIKSEV